MESVRETDIRKMRETSLAKWICPFKLTPKIKRESCAGRKCSIPFELLIRLHSDIVHNTFSYC